jgi:uncharacterized protein (DUF302 family)
MNFIRNFLAVVGLVFIIVAVVAGLQLKDRLSGFDEGAADVYLGMMTKLLDSKNAADSMVWKVPVDEGLKPEDVEEVMMAVAAERNLAITGVFPLGEDIELKTEKPYRYIKLFTFCRSRTAAVMLDYSDAYSAYMPCRIALIEDKEGKYWLYSMDMDLMIYGGEPLPPDLKKQAVEIKECMLEIMQRGATGEF